MVKICKDVHPGDSGRRLRPPADAYPPPMTISRRRADAEAGLTEAGRELGKKGGPARAKALTPEERTAIAKQGGRERAKQGYD